MIRRIARHEIRTLLAEPFTGLGIAVYVLVLAYSITVGASWASTERELEEGILAAEVERFEGLHDRLVRIEAGLEVPGEIFQDPTQPGTVGRSLGERRAVLPTLPLAGISIGQGDLLPAVVPVTTRTRAGTPGREDIANPVHLLSGRLDPAFVILFLLPLLTLALGFDLLSRERETGTLGLLLSQPISAGTLVVGKVLARAVVVLGATVPILLGGTFLAGVSPGSPGVLTGILLWTALIAAYTGVWLGIAALANLVGRGSAEQAVALAAVWILFALVVPSAIAFGGRILHPVPTRAEMIGAERETARIAQAAGNALLLQSYDDHPELLPDGEVNVGDAMAQGYAVQEEIDERMTPVRQYAEERIAAQKRLVQRYRFLSPALLAQEAMDEIAGTGERRYARFLERVEAFRVGFHDHFRPLIYRQLRFTSADVAAIPAWEWEEDPPMVRMAGAARAVGGLAAYLLLLLGLAARILRRPPNPH